MRIVIDGRMMAPRWTGIGLYSRRLVENLQKLDEANDYFVLVDHDQFKHWQPTAKNFKKVLAPYKVYGFAEQTRLPWLIKSLKPDLVHFLHFNVPLFFRGPKIVTIHDTTLIDFNVAPPGAAAAKYWLKRFGMLLAMRRAIQAQTVVVPSEATKAALVKHYGQQLEQRIIVTPEAADFEPGLRAEFRQKPPEVLYIGNFYPYKNLEVVLRAWPEVIKSLPEARLTLGGSTPRFNEQIKARIEKLGIKTSVNLPGFIPPKDLAGYYQRAALFVFMSQSEGFGLPPLEAMAAGVPVVAAKASCLPEVLGDAAQLVDPHDAKALATTIVTLLKNPSILQDLQQRGYRRLEQFSWSKMAQQTLAVYKKFKPV